MSESILSFIVPVYEPDIILFDKVLRALKEQSLKSWEVVFVLDGACPEGRAAIKRVFRDDSNYKVIEIEHGGACKARNAGFPESIGNYVVFMDCDVIIEPHTALGWVEALDKSKEYGFVYSGYSFLNEQGMIKSEPFDPWMLRVRNYISSCFPLRREFFPGWNESLESLQDWDFWLSVVEKGAIGKYVPGSAFYTAYPTPKSISGQGCKPDKWLERMDKVKALHGIPQRDICITSIHNRLDGIALAKAIGADYDDYPNEKPNHYKTIIQLGFSVKHDEFERCASAWGKDHKKVIFWTADDVELMYDRVSRRAQDRYAVSLNLLAKQYVEDKKAQQLMKSCGFNTEVLPLPTISKEEVTPLPEQPKFLVDVSDQYGHVFQVIQEAIPDIKLEPVDGVKEIEHYTGLVCFRQDGLLRPSVKRILAAGRHVVSNIQAPFAGYMTDKLSEAAFVKSFVNKIREAAYQGSRPAAVRYYIDPKNVSRLVEAI